jgi:hypothetical protein
MTNLVGKKSGLLTVMSVSKRKGNNGQTYWHCACECGKESEVRQDNFTSGHTISCGCNHKKANPLKKVQFVISNRPSDHRAVSDDKKQTGRMRRKIEEIKEQRELERALSL